MIVSGGGEDLIAAAQHVLPHYLRRHIRIARLGEIAVRGAADEAAFALRIKPACGFSIWNYWGDRCARRLLLLSPAATTTTAASSSAAWPVLRTLSAASPLVAPASSVVAVVAALAGVTLIAIALLLLTAVTATTTSFAARGLRIVRCLLLLLWRRAAVIRAIGRAFGGRWGIGFGIRRRVRSGGGIW
jgi:hypothetical protein